MAAAKESTGHMEDEASLASRAAWLYFGAGLTQAEVAARLNVAGSKAHRLIARANRDGLIRVFVDGRVAECLQLENALRARYGLAFCEVAPDLGEGALPLTALGLAGANFLRNTIENGRDQVIGVGHGRTLASAAERLPRMRAPEIRIVSLLGGLTRKFAANPFDVIHRLAEKTGAEAWFMPIPFFANSVEDKQVLLAQMGVAEVFALAREASLLLVGIGNASRDSFLMSGGMIGADEQKDLVRAGAEGEMLGHFFDARGRNVETDVSARALSVSLEDMEGRRIVALAGGPPKAPALRAMLKSGLLHGLITDEATATILATQSEDRRKSARTRKPR